jgi:hypothetical protein
VSVEDLEPGQDQPEADEAEASSLAATISSYSLVVAISVGVFAFFSKNKWPVFGQEPNLFLPLLTIWVISACLLEWVTRNRFGTRSDQGFTLLMLAIALANAEPFCRALNAAFDASPPTEVQAKVIGTRQVTGRRSFYYIKVQPEGDLGEGEIRVNYSFYDELLSGDNSVGFKLFKGGFGWPWVDGLTALKASK